MELPWLWKEGLAWIISFIKSSRLTEIINMILRRIKEVTTCWSALPVKVNLAVLSTLAVDGLVSSLMDIFVGGGSAPCAANDLQLSKLLRKTTLPTSNSKRYYARLDIYELEVKLWGSNVLGDISLGGSRKVFEFSISLNGGWFQESRIRVLDICLTPLGSTLLGFTIKTYSVAHECGETFWIKKGWF